MRGKTSPNAGMAQLSIFDIQLSVDQSSDVDVSVESPASVRAFFKEVLEVRDAIVNGESVDSERVEKLTEDLVEVTKALEQAATTESATSPSEKLAGELLAAADALASPNVDLEAVTEQLKKAVAEIPDPTGPVVNVLPGIAPCPTRTLKERQIEFRRTLAHAIGSAEFYVHGGFWAVPITLTEGVHFVVENGGRSERGTAFWLADIIASYQGEAKLRRMEIQFWKLAVVLEEGRSPKGVVTCGNGNGKEVVRQELDYCDFILDEGIEFYVGWNYLDDPKSKTGYRQVRTILLPSEY